MHERPREQMQLSFRNLENYQTLVACVCGLLVVPELHVRDCSYSC